jgi:hypothetical protein
VVSYRRNVAVDLPSLDPSDSTLGGFDGIAEIGFASLDDLIDAVADDTFLGRLDEGYSEYGEVDSRVTMVTTELLLDDGTPPDGLLTATEGAS